MYIIILFSLCTNHIKFYLYISKLSSRFIDNLKYCIDVTKDSFKKRYSGHKSSFNNKKYEHSTTLSSYVWKLKNENVPYRVSWDIAGRAAPFNPATNICRLCLLEKYLIMFRPAGATLNQNSEFFTTCRHKQSELLGKVKFKK